MVHVLLIEIIIFTWWGLSCWLREWWFGWSCCLFPKESILLNCLNLFSFVLCRILIVSICLRFVLDLESVDVPFVAAILVAFAGIESDPSIRIDEMIRSNIASLDSFAFVWHDIALDSQAPFEPKTIKKINYFYVLCYSIYFL